MTDMSQSGMIIAFAAGTISFLSPCVLPLVPGYVSYIAGQSIASRATTKSGMLRFEAVALSLCFVLGFSTIFVILGASATALGQLLISYRYELNIVGGAIVVGFGLFTLGLLRPSCLQRELRPDAVIAGGRPGGAYLLGMAFAFGWSPCIGPILGTILTVGAASATVGKGVTLLASYSLGLGVPFLIAAVFADGLLARLKSIGRAGRILQLIAGAVMIVMGAAMVTGQLSAFSYWLLDTFPLLARIG
jgi:cytochrome c-type biogenesis protein